MTLKKKAKVIPLKEREKTIDSTHKLNIEKQCKLLNFNRISFYYSSKGESQENLEIMNLLRRQYLVTPFYGYRKITVWLQNQNFDINQKRVRRLLKLVNWKTIYREPRTTISIKGHKKYPYLLKNLEITRKNQVWATDIFPLMFKMLDKQGNSDMSERIDIIKQYIEWFGKDTIDCLLADREFVGDKWMEFLNEKKIRYYIRIRNNFKIYSYQKQAKIKAFWLFSNLKVGEF